MNHWVFGLWKNNSYVEGAIDLESHVYMSDVEDIICSQYGIDKSNLQKLQVESSNQGYGYSPPIRSRSVLGFIGRGVWNIFLGILRALLRALGA